MSYTGAFLFIMLMVVMAWSYSDNEIILPEIAAMAVALFAFREQSWMKQPSKIFILPSLTAIIGYGINYLEVSYLMKLVLVLSLMLLLMRMFTYSLAPAFATGFLPIVTNAKSLSFIASILITTFLLMAIVWILKLNKTAERKSSVSNRKMVVYFFIMTLWMLIARLCGHEQLAIIPPIAVVVYESLHMKMYNIKIAVKQTAILFISASIGVIIYIYLENHIIAAILDLLCMMVLLKLFKMKVPAVYAFPFLAFVLPKDAIPVLPLASLCMSIFSLGAVLAYRKYGEVERIEMS